MTTDSRVTEVLAAYSGDRQREAWCEEFLVATFDRTIDVVDGIAQPFTYHDVTTCGVRILTADGWGEYGECWRIAFQPIRTIVRDLEVAEQIVRIRSGVGPRPAMWMRARRGEPRPRP